MIQMKGHVLPDHPLAHYFKGHISLERTDMFRVFKAAVGTHVVGDRVTLSASVPFEVEGVISAASSSDWVVFSLISDSGEHISVWRDGGNLKIATNGHTPGNSGVNFQTNRFSCVVLKWDTTKFSLHENGVELYSVVPTSKGWLDDSFKVLVGGNNSIGKWLDGIPYSCKVWTGGDRITGIQAVSYSDFARSDNIVPNDLVEAGVALSIDDNRPQWLLVDGVYHRVSNGSWGRLGFIESTPDIPYLLDVEILERSAGSLRAYVRNSSDTANIATVIPEELGRYTYLLTPKVENSEGFGVWLDSHDFTGAVRVSLKPAQGWARLYNPAEGSVSRYTKNGQAWRGVNIWDESAVVASGSGFVVNGDGSHTHSGTVAGEVRVSGVLEEGLLYEVDFTASSGGGNFKLGGAQISKNTITPITAGRNTDDLIAENTGVINAIRGYSNSDNQIFRDIHVRRKIPVAPGAMQ